MSNRPTLAAKGLSREDVLAEMRAKAADDADWRRGRTFSLVYHPGDDVIEVAKEAYGLFFAENGLSPMAFPSLRRFEGDVLDIAAALFHGPEAKGSITTGGSESILMAVKAARDRARAERPHVTAPEVILPLSAHPAFEKAAHYFGVRAVHAPLTASGQADVEWVREHVNENTVLIVASAPSYPHGIMDPIADLAAVAADHGIGCHVDACIGGFMLPFAERLGRDIPPFDFRVPGVTSISADLHKYGYAAKGASVVMYRDASLRRHQFFAYGDWPGGVYASPTATGTRAGGSIAAAWAVMKYLGEEGYLRLAKQTLDTTQKLIDGIRAIPGLRVFGDPRVSLFAFGSDSIDVYQLGDALQQKGWALDRQQRPPSLHMTVSPQHARVADEFLADLRDCAASLSTGAPAPEGSAALYGMIGTLPDREVVGGLILEFMDGLYQADEAA